MPSARSFRSPGCCSSTDRGRPKYSDCPQRANREERRAERATRLVEEKYVPEPSNLQPSDPNPSDKDTTLLSSGFPRAGAVKCRLKKKALLSVSVNLHQDFSSVLNPFKILSAGQRRRKRDVGLL